jgi:hypothetical protein
MSGSSISSALSASNALFGKLAATAAASAQSMANYRLQLVQSQLNNQLNKKIAQLQAQSNDPTVSILEQQGMGLQQQLTNYSNAQGQISQNGTVLGNILGQLGTMSNAAQLGDSATFDNSLATINDDIASLQVVSFVPGLQPDGIIPLKTKGIGVGSSANYDLSTPAGQAQANTDLQNAENLMQQMLTAGRENLQLTSSVTTALQGQITGISNQVSTIQNATEVQTSNEIAKLQQQEQTQFHLIELGFGNISETANMMTSVQSYNQLITAQAGTTLSVLTGNSGQPTLMVAAITSPSTIGTINAKSSSSSSTQSGNGSTGQVISTSA